MHSHPSKLRFASPAPRLQSQANLRW